jgi:hypothetical protein
MPQTPDQQPQPPINADLSRLNPLIAGGERQCSPRLIRLSEILELLRAAECGIVYLERDPDVTSAFQTRMHDARIHAWCAMDLIAGEKL